MAEKLCELNKKGGSGSGGDISQILSPNTYFYGYRGSGAQVSANSISYTDGVDFTISSSGYGLAAIINVVGKTRLNKCPPTSATTSRIYGLKNDESFVLTTGSDISDYDLLFFMGYNNSALSVTLNIS